MHYQSRGAHSGYMRSAETTIRTAVVYDGERIGRDGRPARCALVDLGHLGGSFSVTWPHIAVRRALNGRSYQEQEAKRCGSVVLTATPPMAELHPRLCFAG